MSCCVSCQTFQNVLKEATQLGTKIAVFSGLGYGSGFLINHVVQFLNPSFFIKTNFMDPLSGSICCGIFILVDYVAKSILEKITGIENTSQMLTFVRIITVIPLAASATAFEGFALTFSAAYAAVACAIIGYVCFLELAKKFDQGKMT